MNLKSLIETANSWGMNMIIGIKPSLFSPSIEIIMAKEKHIHKLKRHKYTSGSIIYFCTLDCNYKVSPALAVGKRSICNRCGEEFILNEYSVRLSKPHCENCHKPKESKVQIDVVVGEIKPEKLDAEINKPLEQLSLTERLNKAIQIDEDEL